MRRHVLIILLSALFPFCASAQSLAGIPSGGIWFSKDPFFAGEQITVNTVVFNATENEIRGTLEFLDGDALIEKKEITLAASENRVIGFTLLVTEGKHAFRVRVAGGDFIGKEGAPLQLKLQKGVSGDYAVQTTQAVRDALKDTDTDGIADINDSDIDGDRLSNEQEKKLGTNPKIADTDGDGILDGVDKNPLRPDVIPGVVKAITSEDTEKVAEKVEKILPTSVVRPVLDVATPVIGTMETFRVGQANRNNERIVGTIDDIIEKVGTTKVLGAQAKASTTATGTIESVTGKPTGWSVFGKGVTSSDFVKTPFGYVKLLFFLVFQWLVGKAWIFYVVISLVVFRLLVSLKRFVFNRGE